MTHEELLGLEPLQNEDILPFHQSLDGYAPTPLYQLQGLAAKLGLKELWLKDESQRFGLNAFKALGPSYAIYKLLQRLPSGQQHTFCTATDGNHGRAVAWAAVKAGHKAVVYVPQHTVEARIRNIQKEGAEVVVVNGSYDETVKEAAEIASQKGWHLVQDTAWPGYTEIPGLLMAGYTTHFKELENTLHTPDEPQVDFVFLQAGVGSWGAAAAWYYKQRYGAKAPKLICVEPIEADCFVESAIQGKRSSSKGKLETIMAGLNCGTPSLTAWPILRRSIHLFMAIDDEYARKAIRLLYHNTEQDPRIQAGETGVGGLAGLLALLQHPALEEVKQKLGLGKQSRILVYNTEGATDPENFARITGVPLA